MYSSGLLGLSSGPAMTLFDYRKVNVHWFPSHMRRGLDAMTQKIGSKVDLVIEVRDARYIPVSSANPLLERMLRKRPRIIVFNKCDLADEAANQELVGWAAKRYDSKAMLLSNYGKDDYKQLFRMVVDTCKEMPDPMPSPRALTSGREMEAPRTRVLVVGVPNVGKSTVLNRLRAIGTPFGGNAARVGNIPGVTRALSDMVKISMKPPIFIYDSPGVLMPKIDRPEVGLKLAITGAIMDSIPGPHLLTDYLLYKLNALGNETYLKAYGLNGPIGDPFLFLTAVAKKTGNVNPKGNPNYTNAASVFLKAFRTGEFGRFTLDAIPSNLKCNTTKYDVKTDIEQSELVD